MKLLSIVLKILATLAALAGGGYALWRHYTKAEVIGKRTRRKLKGTWHGTRLRKMRRKELKQFFRTPSRP